MAFERPGYDATVLDSLGITLDPSIEMGINASFQQIGIGDLGANGNTVVGFYQAGKIIHEVSWDETKEGSSSILITPYPNR